MYYGKIIGGVIGLMVLGPIGLILGIFVGHLFDNGLMQTLKFASPQNIARIKNSFFETTFLLSGYLAKADGRISQQEIDQTESIISQMGLDAQQRKRAISLFQQGSAQDFQLEPTVSSFMETCRGQRQLCQTLLFFLISLALADHKIEQVEHNVLQRIATLLS